MVTVMLSFLVGVLDSARKETVKSTAQEELQSAIAYIADDLQEAMYIYGSDGLTSINSQLPHFQTSPQSTQCNTTNCTPVLVFWKRIAFDPNSSKDYSAGGGSQKLGCMPYIGTTATTCASSTASVNPYKTAFGRATYSYSLVAYYLRNDSNNNENFSGTARILRWELKDGYAWYCGANPSIKATDTGASTNCPTDKTSPAITAGVTNYYFIDPDAGFKRPDFSTDSSIFSWTKAANFDFTTNPFVTLVDFMDDTTYESIQGGSNDAGTPSTATAPIRIPIGKNVTISGVVTNPDCDDPSVGVGNVNPVTTTNATGNITLRVPADFADATSNPSGLSSFYMCVTPSNVTARIFLRGNAIARLGSPVIAKTLRVATDNNTPFFPTANVRSFGRSAIGITQ